LDHCVVDHSLPEAPPPGNIEQSTLQAFHSLGRLFHLQRQAMQRRLSSPNAHHGELICLRLLADSDGMSQRDLAETLHLSRPRITSILQHLESSGAVRREADPEDQRVTRVFLTRDGRQRELLNRKAFEDYVNGTIGRLSDADKAEMARILDQVSGHIAALIGPDGREREERRGS
jgi:MarR family transcriptional regulator, organic hydroperoxide resistance regulator